MIMELGTVSNETKGLRPSGIEGGVQSVFHDPI
jgi:hypothetical protein